MVESVRWKQNKWMKIDYWKISNFQDIWSFFFFSRWFFLLLVRCASHLRSLVFSVYLLSAANRLSHADSVNMAAVLWKIPMILKSVLPLKIKRCTHAQTAYLLSCSDWSGWEKIDGEKKKNAHTPTQQNKLFDEMSVCVFANYPCLDGVMWRYEVGTVCRLHSRSFNNLNASLA